MCSDCQDEYGNPLNRRFHAQPNACPVCGPQVWLASREKPNEPLSQGEEAIAAARQMLKKGAVLAIKGIGGFHLACDATNETSISMLRERKHRVNKPFAIMAMDCPTVEQFCYLGEAERALLESPQRPIVLLRRQENSPISQLTAPSNAYLGVMLPYTPLHYLLLEKRGDGTDIPALVMTSGNLSEEPIAIDNEEALTRLDTLADAFLFHNRPINMRCDDSVTRVFDDKESIIRRSRGYSPFPVKLTFKMKQILACGGELKNTFCLTKQNYAFISQHIGDMENMETMASFESGIEHFKRIFRIRPEIIAYDLHPEYLATQYAIQQKSVGIKLIGVQHHQAHIASCMADNEENGPVIGVAFDGTGYGEDGQIWGSEFMVGDFQRFERSAHFKYVVLPGGEAAIKKPYRMALSYLNGLLPTLISGLTLFERVSPLEAKIIKKQIETQLNSPLTSSCGRLFDAISSLLGICDVVTYEGEAAVKLEMLAGESIKETYYWPVNHNNLPIVVDQAPLLKAIIKDIRAGVPIPVISARFHNSLAKTTSDVCVLIRKHCGLSKVALSGGVFQNLYLLRQAIDYLEEKGFTVLIHHQVPCNDGGLSLGQAVIANARIP